MERFEKLSRAGAWLVLVASAVLNLQAARRLRPSAEPASPKEIRGPMRQTLACANATSAAVCIVAALAYTDMHAAFTGLTQSDVRSLDWLVTCPLLVVEMGSLLGAPPTDSTTLCAAGASMLMVLTGWNAHNSAISLFAGFVFLMIVAACLSNLWSRRQRGEDSAAHQRVVAWAFGLWPLYGLVACAGLLCATSADATNSAYNVLDIGSKGLFGFAVAFLALSSD